MGIDLQCGETSFGCSYGSWNSIRTDILEATFDYIDDLIKNKLEFDIYELYELIELKKRS